MLRVLNLYMEKNTVLNTKHQTQNQKVKFPNKTESEMLEKKVLAQISTKVKPQPTQG